MPNVIDRRTQKRQKDKVTEKQRDIEMERRKD